MEILENILKEVPVIDLNGDIRQDVNEPCIDSREMKPGGIFIAIRGTATDGHLFISKAIENGAGVVVCEEMPEKITTDVTYVKVEDTSQACGNIAAAYYGHPSTQLKLVGVTGTNGKTTIVTLLFNLFRDLGYSCGLLSTVRNKIGNQVLESAHTTPDAIHFHRLLAEMVDAGCEYAFAEVSSHAIHQKRIAGLHFAGGIFSNITHEHLDYHKTF